MVKHDKRTVLIVDDTESNIDILLDILGDSYDILVALDAESAFAILKEEKVDLILLDVMMPVMNGFEACEVLKSQVQTRDIPVVFITAKTDEDTIAEAFKIGGVDFIAKPFKPLELLARIKTQIKLRSLMDDLEYIASYDSMTGVYNRRVVFEKGYRLFQDLQEGLFAVMIDIDKFKGINDKYGHAFGDRVIKSVAKNIQSNIIEGSLFGRIGGEEFAILTNSESRELVMKSVEGIRKAVESLEIYTQEGEAVKVTLSAGIAEKDKTTSTLDALLNSADNALYEAKGKGRNRTMFR